VKEVDPLWSIEHFRWKLEGDPTGPGVLSWATVDGIVRACLTVAPRRMWWNGRSVRAGELGDGYTAPAYRGDGLARGCVQFYVVAATGVESLPATGALACGSLFTRLVGLCIEASRRTGMEFVYGTPNQNSCPSLVRWSGFVPHPVPLESLERAPDQVTDNPPARSDLPESLTPDDPRLDALWWRLRAGSSFGPVRDSAYFRHRFGANPLASYRIIGISDHKGLRGVLVTRAHTVVPGRRDICLADWLCKAGDLPRLVTHVLTAERHRTDLFTAWAGARSSGASVLRSLGFRRSWTQNLVFHRSPVSNEILTAHQLSFTISASDNI
jgi:hypothetical protein